MPHQSDLDLSDLLAAEAARVVTVTADAAATDDDENDEEESDGGMTVPNDGSIRLNLIRDSQTDQIITAARPLRRPKSRVRLGFLNMYIFFFQHVFPIFFRKQRFFS